MLPHHRRRRRARRALSPAANPEAMALLCQKQIARHAYRLLARRVGRENAQSIAVDVWLWLLEGRMQEPDFLNTPKAFRQTSIWYRRPWMTTIKVAVDGLIYALTTAGIFV